MQYDAVSCIVPVFNEAARLGPVFDVLTRVPGISEVICVDDGSFDGTTTLIRTKYPSVKYVRLSRNRGKSEAVAAGLTRAKGEAVLLFDADIRNLREEELREALRVWQRTPMDMLILHRIRSPFPARLIRFSVLLGGERIVRRSDLAALFKKIHPTRYQLEAAMNRYMMEHGKTVCVFPYTGENTYAYGKHGIRAMLLKYMRQLREMSGVVSAGDMFRQMLFFARKQV